MIIRTFLDKSNTIYKDIPFNTGLNPVCELNYGNRLSRALIHFDISKLKNAYLKGDIQDVDKVSHTLKLTNCSSLEDNFFNNPQSNCSYKKRATSFDVIIFTIPMEWDAGVGFTFSDTYINISKNNVSIDGSNWGKPRNGYLWGEEGIYSIETLSSELDKFTRGEDSIVVGRQHFDFGNENFEFDLTNIVTKYIIENVDNMGFGIAFSPLFESEITSEINYIGFFNNHTNTFFEPYLETIIDNTIVDDRTSFYINKINKLYLYVNINNQLTNLDILPNCFINDIQYDVKQCSQGVYYVEVPTNSELFTVNTINYDLWTNIYYNNMVLDDVEMEFVVLNGDKSYFNIGNKITQTKTIKPTITGISTDEVVNMSDIRKLSVLFKKAYTSKEEVNVSNCEYRLYTKNGNSEIDVINFHPINKSFLENYFYINTSEFIPSDYFIDIRVNIDNEIKTYKELLRFKISDNISAMNK